MSPGLCWAGHGPTVGVLVARVDAAGAPATPWHLHLAAGVVEARASGAWRATATCKMWLQRASPHDVRCMPAFFGAATSLARLQRPVPWTHSQGGASGQEPHRTSGQAARHGAPPRQASYAWLYDSGARAGAASPCGQAPRGPSAWPASSGGRTGTCGVVPRVVGACDLGAGVSHPRVPLVPQQLYRGGAHARKSGRCASAGGASPRRCACGAPDARRWAGTGLKAARRARRVRGRAGAREARMSARLGAIAHAGVPAPLRGWLGAAPWPR